VGDISWKVSTLTEHPGLLQTRANLGVCYLAVSIFFAVQGEVLGKWSEQGGFTMDLIQGWQLLHDWPADCL
jgi:hypothetical protein